jgi:signal transduction histidine kinase/DNA-binding LytR/AlgR family response regulator
MATILVVDDYPTNREVLVTLLGYFHHRVLEAGDGVEGLEMVSTAKPDLIIADILMPTMNGFEFVGKLRRNPSTSGIPVIFYSATFLDEEMQALANACGVSRLLNKPSPPEETLRVVNEALGDKQSVAPPPPTDEAEAAVVQILNKKLFQRNKDLADLNAQLEDRIAERTADLERANRLLKEEMKERERTEKELRQMQRLDAIGRLAGGVAHDFNNLLGVILGQSEILLDRSPDQASIHGLEMIRESARRGASLTRQLLAFGRRQLLDTRVVNLNTILGDVEKLLRRVIGEDIELEFQTEDKLGNVEADPSQVEQVIVNLAINARDAMPEGGKLLIATANVHLDEAYADRRAVVKPGRYVQVVVSDTGCGMDEQTQSRIFEPFFTTKEQGKGTGLGLATVYGIVKQSGGYIWVYSEPGHGSAFKIYLPMVQAATEAPRHMERNDDLPRGSETILLVEDDASLREVTCEFLRSGGYVVLPAASPEEALDLAKHHNGQINFLLTDVIMPKMNGRELASRLIAVRPGLKILYVSGYTDGIVRDGAHAPLEEGLAFLQKPYTRHALMRKVREILDSQTVKSVAQKN